jgi:hypothetical protein
LTAQHAKEKADVLGIMARMETEFQDTEADAKHEFSSLRDDVKNKVRREEHYLVLSIYYQWEN